MILYRIGEIIYKNQNNLIFESYGTGYSVIVPDEKRFEIKSKLKLFICEINTEYHKQTYAFKDFKERLLFLDLININGIGPRAAFNLLNIGWEKCANLILASKQEELLKIPYINIKMIKNIFNELQGKWMKLLNINNEEIKNKIKVNDNLEEVKNTLKMLGFKTKQIDNAITELKTDTDIELMIEEAINIISKSYDKQSNNISTN
ncbi:Holliday junction branch migration protein RuvA [Mycoplasma sp. 1018B]|uniref:Holliday junction branch migration protein RuvA n=1 Tax=Mycoplasma sp. 1018B TaxID=2967302 RepID=UPI00211C1B2F|nr:Holliday junction branch migration protein RuvA [Mycoplasma sp. 1018B]UUM18977.1 Holliday junction branch migration protein RuvA [Mycoplasma sp. 1018B]